jgi:predicted ATPase/signal transduction histidine kinase
MVRDLVRGLGREAAGTAQVWRSRIRDAMGPSATAISTLVPELAELLGEAEPSADGGTEAERGFPLAFQVLLQALATSESPLLLFLDDLQWADASSLRLLPPLAAPEGHHLLVVGAYRPFDHGGSPLARTLETLRTSGVPVHALDLSPLDLAALTTLTAETLRSEPERVRPLAAIVAQKTAGNPFFVGRFLRHLRKEGILAFDVERGAWEWDERRTATACVTENVVELMVTAIRRLPPSTQRVLEVAGCLPGRIDLGLLATALGASVSDTARALWSALEEGLLVPAVSPLSAGVAVPRGGDGLSTEEQGAPDAAYRFVHDRVQEAACSLLSVEEQRRVHLAVGRALLERGGEARFFDAVDQQNRGADLLLQGSERRQLAELNLRAARQARTSSAFAQGLSYASRGLELLPEGAAREHHVLWLALTREAAEGACLTGDLPGALSRVAAALPHVATPLERLDLDCLGLVASAMLQDFRGVVVRAREALRGFGMELPQLGEAAAEARAELAVVEDQLRRRRPEELLAAPAMRDPDALACTQILSKLSGAMWRSAEQGMFSFAMTRMVALSLRHGITPELGPALTRVGMLIGEARGDYSAGYELGQLGIEMARRRGDPGQEARAIFGFAIITSHWKDPFRARSALYQRVAAAGMAGGDVEYVAAGLEYQVENLLVMGAELDQVARALDTAQSFARKVDYRNASQSLRLLRQIVRCLQGRTRGPSLDDDAFETARFVEEITRTYPGLRCRYEVHALRLRYLLGDVEGAREMSAAATTHFAGVRASVEISEHNFYTSLALAASGEGAPPEERRARIAAIADNQRLLRRWAEACPENFRHKHLLVEAELARVEGRSLDLALDLYEQAIEGAHREGFLQDEALARELCARCLYGRGRRATARFYVQAAVQAYAHWGATAKVEALEEEFHVILVSAPTVVSGIDDPCHPALDVISLLKAAETLSSEVVLGRLLEKLMAVCLEAAGAQRGALILDEGGARVVRALGSVSGPVATEASPLAAAPLPRALIEDVFSRGEPVVLAEASRRGRFVADPYVAEHGVKSALAVPLRKQGRTLGVLYLENDLATSVFTAGRVRVLELLSSQMAVALENSLLFEKLTVEIGERARAEQGLRCLSEASALLSESLDFEATLVRVARLAVPFLATWCVVDVVSGEGTAQRVAAAHADPGNDPLLRELCERYPPEAPFPPAPAPSSGAAYRCPDVTAAFTAGVAHDVRHADLLRILGSASLMVAPLVARERRLGTMMLFSAAPGRTYDPTDLALAEELARRAAFAIDNASLYRQAQEAIRLREDFVSVASHELNTPITSLQLAVQGLMRSQSTPSQERVQKALQTVERQGFRLASLISEMLDISRISAGKLELHLETVDLAGVARESIERLDQQIVLSRCPLSLRAPGPVVGRWDHARLAQVVTNLVTNAIKFGNCRPVEVAALEASGTARLVVEDHGIGIEPTRLPHVFDRFERGVSARHYGGLGLGLYIVREIVAALGGSVHAESELGAGARFTVELPCTGPPSGETDPGPAAPDGCPARRPGAGAVRGRSYMSPQTS